MFMSFHSNKYINASEVFWCYISRPIKGNFFYIFNFRILLVVKLINNFTFYKNVKEKCSRYFIVINFKIECCDQGAILNPCSSFYLNDTL